MNSIELQRGAFQTGFCYCVDVTHQEKQNFGVLLDQLYPKQRPGYKLCERGLEEPQGEGSCLICPFTARAGIVH